MNAPDRLQTERLALRRFVPADRARLLEIRSDPEVAAGLAHRPELAEQKTDWFLARDERSWNERGFGAYVVEQRRTGRVLGHAGLWYVDEFDAVELLYGYERAAWGSGIATEAGQALVAVAFDLLGLARLIALCAPDNLGSRRVIEKLGFRRLGPAKYRGGDVLLHERVAVS